jgi:NAD(P)-dependent dehydrogenase (short-subunit alcohol dehydrogenase family)
MFAKAYVENGATVYICSRKESSCQKTATQLSAIGPGRCISLPSIDLAKGKAECYRVAEELQKKGVEKLDILVNNSGVTWGEPFEKFDEEKGFDRVMNVNVKAVYYVTIACLPLLRAAATVSSPSRVVNVASILGIMATPLPTPSYDSSKAAVIHLTKKFASFLAPEHITVNAIAPGIIPTNMGNQAIGLAGGEEKFSENVPLGRVGLPVDMAGVVLYLSSPASCWVTGIVIPVDGGQMLSRL